MQAEFNLSEKFDQEHIEPVNAFVTVKEHVDKSQSIEIQACGNFVTLEVKDGKLKVLECSHEYKLESMKL